LGLLSRLLGRIITALWQATLHHAGFEQSPEQAGWIRAGSILSQTPCESRLPESTGRAEVTGLAARKRFQRRVSAGEIVFRSIPGARKNRNAELFGKSGLETCALSFRKTARKKLQEKREGKMRTNNLKKQ
jgi:hypothetical protein